MMYPCFEVQKAMSPVNPQPTLPLTPPPALTAAPPAVPQATAVPSTEPVGALSFGQLLPRLQPGLTLLVGAPLASPLALPFCAPYLLEGQTVVAVDGANCFDLYRLTEWARRKQVDPLALLRRLRVARAFTPFQLATILHHMDAEMQRHRARRLIITGFPDCLFDEELTAVEARNTFERCRQSLLRLRERPYTMLLFADPPRHAGTRLLAERSRFFDALAALSRMVLEVGNAQHAEFRAIKSSATSQATPGAAPAPALSRETSAQPEFALEEVPHG
jgi:hypothetical protein